MEHLNMFHWFSHDFYICIIGLFQLDANLIPTPCLLGLRVLKYLHVAAASPFHL